MRARPVPYSHLLLAFSNSAVVRPPCSDNSRTSNAVHVCPTSCYSRWRVIFSVLCLALVAFPTPVIAAPWMLGRGVHGVLKRQSANAQNSQSNGGINMTVWLPILLVTVVFVLFSFITCIRRCAAADAAVRDATTANRAPGSNPVSGNTARTRRRPQRTPSQISTRSLPPYMKEPGDQELVLFRGPSDMADMDEDEPAPPPAMPTLAEEEEDTEMRGATFDIALGRIESVDTMPDASTANLIRRTSGSMPRPPELGHPAMPQDHHQSRDAHSLDSAGSETELLVAHQRGASVDNNAVSMGEVPSYSEAVSAEGGMTTISLNDPEPDSTPSNTALPPSLVPSRARARLSFLLQNPFSSRDNTSSVSSHDNQLTRSESPAQHLRSGSALSRLSTRDSHESHHSRNNLSRSRSGSNSNLLRAFRSHSPGLHAGSSTISLDSISAPLTHTATRAEFYAPKGGLLTAEQIKLITSREALERFGMPYGPDAVAAYSLSRERSEPPPNFESVTGEHRGQPDESGSGVGAAGATAQRTEALDAATGLPRSTPPSSSQGRSERAGSHASTVMSYETAPESEGQAQVVEMGREGETDGGDESRTDQAMTPRPARPLNEPR